MRELVVSGLRPGLDSVVERNQYTLARKLLLLCLDGGVHNIIGSLVYVMFWAMMFGEIICKVCFASFPVDAELPLTDSVLDPIESHVHCLGSFGFDCVVGDSFGGCIVCADGGGSRLWVSHFCECCYDRLSGLAVHKECSCFGFCWRRT